MARGKKSRPRKPRGETLMLTVSKELNDWLIEHTEKRGALSVQETVRQILTTVRTSEQGQQQAV